jgi:hypothetical protein
MVTVMTPPDLDSLGQTTPHGDLLTTALEYDGAGGNPSDALDIRTGRHSESKRLDSGVVVIDGDDLEPIALASAAESTGLTDRDLGFECVL